MDTQPAPTPTASQEEAPKVEQPNPSVDPPKQVLEDSFEDTEKDQQSASIIVKNVPVSADPENSTTKQLNDFFSFCGAINSLSLVEDETEPNAVSALITFENVSAARTALLLNHTVLHERVITVELAPYNLGAPAQSNQSSVVADNAPAPVVPQASAINQLLAQGYVLGLGALEKAQHYDEEHQITSQLNEMSKSIEGKVSAIDQEYQISEKIQNAAQQINDLDQHYQVSPTVISAVENASQGIHNLDEQYQISQTLGQTIQNAQTQVLAMDNHYQVSENVIAVAEKATSEGVRIFSNVSEELRLQERSQEAANAISYGAAQVSQFLETNPTVQGIGAFFSNAIGTALNTIAPPESPVVQDDQPHITIGQPTKYEPVTLVQTQINETP